MGWGSSSDDCDGGVGDVYILCMCVCVYVCVFMYGTGIVELGDRGTFADFHRVAWHDTQMQMQGE